MISRRKFLKLFAGSITVRAGLGGGFNDHITMSARSANTGINVSNDNGSVDTIYLPKEGLDFDMSWKYIPENTNIDTSISVRLPEGSNEQKSFESIGSGTIEIKSSSGRYSSTSEIQWIDPVNYPVDIFDHSAIESKDFEPATEGVTKETDLQLRFSFSTDNIDTNSITTYTISVTDSTTGSTVTITDNSGSELSNYPVKVQISGSNEIFNKAKNDGSDVRFIDSSDNILYSWREKFDPNNEKAVFWVNLPSVPAGGSTDIELKYGDGTIKPEANSPKEVFAYYSNFDVDDGWNKNSNRVGINTSEGYAFINEDTQKDEYMWYDGFQVPDNGNNVAVDMDFKSTNAPLGDNAFARTNIGIGNFASERDDITSSDNGIFAEGSRLVTAYDNGVNTSGKSASTTVGGEYHATLTRQNDNQSLVFRDAYGSDSNIIGSVNRNYSMGDFDRLMFIGTESQYSTRYTATTRVERLWVRQHADPEPTVDIS